MKTFEEYWENYGELHASMCNGNIKLFAKEIWQSASTAVNVECAPSATYTTLQEDWRQWWLKEAQSDDCDVPPISRQFREAWTLGLEAGRREACQKEHSL